MLTQLVVAHQTAESPQLTNRLKALAASNQGMSFVLLVPATSIEQVTPAVTASPRQMAGERAKAASSALQAAGVNVTRSVVGDEDPLVAIAAEIGAHPGLYQGIVISTFPLGLSKWLGLDLPHQARRRFGLPVIHVVAPPADAERAGSPAGGLAWPCRHEAVLPRLLPRVEKRNEEMEVFYVCKSCGQSLEPDEVSNALGATRP